MGQDGFGTLSPGLMERGTERVRAVLDEDGPTPTSVSFDLTYSSRKEATATGPHTDRAYDVPPATRTTAFAKVPPVPGAANGGERRTGGFGTRQPFGSKPDPAPHDMLSTGSTGTGAETDVVERTVPTPAAPARPAAPTRPDSLFGRRLETGLDDAAAPEGSATPISEETPSSPAHAEPPTQLDPDPPARLVSSVFRPAQSTPRSATSATPSPVTTAPYAPAARPVPTNPVGDQKRTLEERRAGSGANLTIQQPQAGDMSQVTVTMNGAKIDHTTPQKGGQAPSSVTYERRNLSELAQDAEALASGERPEPVWIETPTYSGPDRRLKDVSPEIERRKTVPPRIKVGVRLEQERYLRLKFAVLGSGRTQQDIVTSALDAYLDELGVDRFIRIAMGFGVASNGDQLDDTGT